MPYTVYSTGIGWRDDQVDRDVAALDNPYDVFWDPQYSGKLAVIDDWHTAMAMVRLRAGIPDVNTDEAARPRARSATAADAMQQATKPKVTM